MQVKLKSERVTCHGTTKAGAVVEIADGEALRLIEAGQASPVEEKKAVKNGKI
jgi:hypothetical protein